MVNAPDLDDTAVFGGSLITLGDHYGDGYDDIAIAAHRSDPTRTDVWQSRLPLVFSCRSPLAAGRSANDHTVRFLLIQTP